MNDKTTIPSNEVTSVIIDEEVNKAAAQGLHIEAMWQATVLAAGLRGAPSVQLNEMRKAYFMGAQMLYTSIMSIFNSHPGEDPTEDDFTLMAGLAKELRDFEKSCEIAQPGVVPDGHVSANIVEVPEWGFTEVPSKVDFNRMWTELQDLEAHHQTTYIMELHQLAPKTYWYFKTWMAENGKEFK